VLGVLDEYVELLELVLIQPILERGLPPMEHIMALLEGYGALLLESDFQRGCPIGNLALEVGEQSPEVREKLVENFTGWRHWVSEWLRDDGVEADVAEDLSQLVLAVMEGGVMQARVARDIEPFAASVRGVKRCLEHI